MVAADLYLNGTTPVKSRIVPEYVRPGVRSEALVQFSPSKGRPSFNASLTLETKARRLSRTRHSADQRILDELELECMAAIARGQQDSDRLRAAAQEAFRLISWRIFSDQVFPRVRIDDEGEICFVVAKDQAYVDIGVSGHGIVSFGIRNDQDPSASDHGDEPIESEELPQRLRAALSAL
jgi:hypothetical protein